MKDNQGTGSGSAKRASRVAVAVFACLVLFSLAATCGNKRTPSTAEGDAQVGMASWYGKKFHGKKTASGERFNMFALTGAHKTLPFNTRVKVTSLSNHKSVKVRINDRGPWTKGRIIDLSYAAAKRIDMIEKGVIKVRVEVISRPE